MLLKLNRDREMQAAEFWIFHNSQTPPPERMTRCFTTTYLVNLPRQVGNLPQHFLLPPSPSLPTSTPEINYYTF